MSQENVRTLMRGYEVFNRGDTPAISKLAREIGTPDVECGAVGAFPSWEEFEVTLTRRHGNGLPVRLHKRNSAVGPRAPFVRACAGKRTGQSGKRRVAGWLQRSARDPSPSKYVAV
jgi:hypothetical protein